MELEEKIIFITSIYQGNVEDVDHEKILDEVYALKDDDFGRNMEEYAGWHSNQISVEDVENTTEIIKVVRSIYGAAAGVARSWNYNPELVFNACWLNINSPGNFNEQHRHPATNLSAVYYVKANENSGNIWFIRDGRTEDYFHSNGRNTIHTAPRTSEEVTTGKFYIFPSHLDHKVDPNLSNEDRISLAFNFSFK